MISSVKTNLNLTIMLVMKLDKTNETQNDFKCY